MIPAFSRQLPPPPGMSFPDVTPNDWFHDYVAWVYDKGFITGYEDGTFRPNNPITREELAALMARAQGIPVRLAGSLPFSDTNRISDWARNYVYATNQQGWMLGDANGSFRPQHHTTRAEITALFARILGRGITNYYSLQDVSEDLRLFSDVTDPQRWFYYYVIEASHSHWYVMKDGVEIWISVD